MRVETLMTISHRLLREITVTHFSPSRPQEQNVGGNFLAAWYALEVLKKETYIVFPNLRADRVQYHNTIKVIFYFVKERFIRK